MDLDDTITTGPTLPGEEPGLSRGLPRPEQQRPPELEVLRARLAAELFGVAMEAPRLGRFQILEKLGEGGMGRVYAAYDQELDRRVAIKLLLSDLNGPQGTRRRLLREAQGLAKLSHPNVVQVYEVGEHAGQIYLAMEYVRGHNAAEWLKCDESGRHPWRAVLEVFVAAGRGLAAAHAAGLVHRDFKPANVLIGDDGQVRVADFGLARAAEDATAGTFHDGGPSTPSLSLAETATRTGAMSGTPAYMAPEVFDGARADAAADQYAFCMVLYEGLYGGLPYPSGSVAELVLAKLRGEVKPPPAGIRVPGWLHAAILRGLSVEPTARWPSMTVLLAEIGRDRGSIHRRRAWIGAGVLLSATTVFAGVGVWESANAARAEATRARRAEAAAVVEAERAERAAFEREALADAHRAGEVIRLAATPGRERDALVLGIQAVAPHSPDFTDAPAVALEGLAHALEAPIAVRTMNVGTSILRVEFSPDGDSLASFDTAGVVRLWDARTGESRWATDTNVGDLAGHFLDPGWRGLVFSPDGARLTGTDPSRCRIWSTDDGALALEIEDCTDPLFSADGARVFGNIRRADRHVGVAAWDAVSGELLWSDATLQGGASVRLHPDGQRLIVARPDNAIEVRRADSGQRIDLLPAAPGTKPSGGRRFALSPDGDILAAGEGPDRVRLWDLQARRGSLLVGASGELSFSADGRRLFVSGLEALQVFAADSGEQSARWPRGSVALAVAGDKIVSFDGVSAQLRDAGSGEVAAHIVGHHGWIRWVAASPDSTRIATASEDGTIKLWKIDDPRLLDRWQPRERSADETITLVDDEFVATRVDATHTRIYAPGEASPRVSVTTLAGGFQFIARAQDGFLVWPAVYEGPGTFEVRFFDAASGDERFRLPVRATDIPSYYDTHLASARRSPIAAVDRLDGATAVFELQTGATRCVVNGSGALSAGLTLQQGGALGATIDDRGTIRIFDGQTCEVRHSLAPFDTFNAYFLSEFRFSGAGLLTARHRQRTVVHEPSTGAELFRIDDACASDQYGGAELSPDGIHLVTYCGSEYRARIWNTREKRVLAILEGVEAPVEGSTRFSNDGARLVSRAEAGDIVTWDPRTGTLVSRIRRGATSDASNFLGIRGDGEAVRTVDRGGAISTYSSSRAGLVAAACRALEGTDVMVDVAQQCAHWLSFDESGSRGSRP